MITVEGERAALSGPVTLAGINAILEAGARVLKASSLTVDLAGVTEVDSTAVSLLLEWQRAAQRERRAITFTNHPANLKSLIELYGLTELLAVARGNR